MSREQQMLTDLREISTELFGEEYAMRNDTLFLNIAIKLTEKGYRLSTDVAREIFDAIDDCFSPIKVFDYAKLAKIRKKYLGETQ